MRRIAFITESSARPNEPMPAHQFFQGTQSRWVNKVIEYMEVRDFPHEDIFFLSHYEQRVIGYKDLVEPYPKQKYHPRKNEAIELAHKVVNLILRMESLPFVEIHAGRTFSDPLKQLLDEHNVLYRVYGSGIPLGSKPNYYADLIEEELNKRKLKEIQREKWQITSMIRLQTPQEASEVVTSFSNSAHLYGIERNLEELKELLGNYNQKRKDVKNALGEMEQLLQEEDQTGELAYFLQAKGSLAELHADSNFESIKNKYGKCLAKFTLCLIKQSYVLQSESKISAALLRTQIALIK
ncbi:hypothetical protein M2444_006153 [Paenibacillus sp. PastF-3]|uniref:hypothetical protein n=1 Tax=unclassified Paenibacillus TaxID=185978 RepID=UPI0024742319|nr:hypothetical protein [Paenibacillus sp. PastF-3]MDH6374303.1 hypothetical protein [Paenibacillus sp. PastF-3]